MCIKHFRGRDLIVCSSQKEDVLPISVVTENPSRSSRSRVIHRHKQRWQSNRRQSLAELPWSGEDTKIFCAASLTIWLEKMEGALAQRMLQE